jgi:iron complex outermembrane recepter protein
VKTFKMIYPTQPANRRGAFAVSSTATGCAILLMAAAGAAQAQQAAAAAPAAGEPEEVIVTGIRAAIEGAISIKKKSESIVEAVTAEDIGKLPDTSIAESIARLPGLAAQRTNGRATAISVRGFSPDFSTALLNGREQVSTGDSRFVEFDQYPSELLSGVTVYKTPDGDLVGQGLSATINMTTVRPLEFGKRALVGNYRKEQLGKGLSTPAGDGSRINFSYIDQYADHTLGLAIGYARLKESTGTTQNYSAWGTNNVCPVANNNGCPVPTLGIAPGGFNDLVDKTDNKREAIMATLEFKPNENFTSTLDYFYTKFDINLLEQGVQAPLAPAYPEWGQNYMNNTVVPDSVVNGVIVAGHMPGWKGLSRNDSTGTHDKVYAVGWNNAFRFDDSWTGAVDLSTAEAKRKAANTQSTAGLVGDCRNPATPSACGTISWTGFDGKNVLSAKYNYTPSLTDTSVMKLTDVEGWGGNITNFASTTPQAGYASQPSTDDKLNSYRFSAKHNLSADTGFTDVDFGLNYADRSKTRVYVEGRELVGPASSPFAAVDVPGATVATAPASGFTYLAWNPDGSIGPIYTVASKLQQDIANKNWKVAEKVITAYSKLNIDTTMGGKPLRGNLGLQIVHTDQSSTAFTTDGSACPGDVCALGTTTAGAKYYDVLPSLNLVADLGTNQTLRFGLARQMARPTLNDMRASTKFSVDSQQGILTGDSGDPKLRPFRAEAWDLSYEKYFGNKGYVSAAVFYKDLKSYIVKSLSYFDYGPYVIPGVTPLPTGGGTVGTIVKPTNGSGGSIEGLELSASVPFSMMTDWLEGFGIQASYSLTNSAVQLPLSGFDTNNITLLNIPLPGLSRTVHQLTFYYERFGFSARIGQRYRSNFIGDITDYKGDNQLVFVKAEHIADLQIGYEFQHGPVKGLSLLFQANNINNQPYVEYKDDPTVETKHVNYGKTLLFGVNYRL